MKSNIVIIDYGAGNVFSVQQALRRLGYSATLSNNADEIQYASHVIFPGVGQAAAAMHQLKQNGLDKVIPQLQAPVLGICLGMQLLCNYSEEGDTEGLGIFPLTVKQFTADKKIPHMGWNTLNNFKSPLFSNIDNNAYVYFVHSYYVPHSEFSIATCNYGGEFAAAIGKNNFYACQFHPEKSAAVGEQILINFLQL